MRNTRRWVPWRRLMGTTLEQFREAVSTHRRGRKHGARRYDEDLVAFAVEHVRAVVASGGSVHAAAKELGISTMTIRSWQRRAGVAQTGKLRTVVVSASQPSSSAHPSTLRVTTREGHIVSGLDVTQLAALLRALS
jgi:transposase-like protein